MKGVEDHTQISVEEMDVDGDGDLDTVVDLGTGSTQVVEGRTLDSWSDDDYDSGAPEGGDHDDHGREDGTLPTEPQEPEPEAEFESEDEDLVWEDTGADDDPEEFDVEDDDEEMGG